MPTETVTRFDNRIIQQGDTVWYYGNDNVVAADVRAVSTTGITKLAYGNDSGEIIIANADNSNLDYDGAATTTDGLAVEHWMVRRPTTSLLADLGTASNGSAVNLNATPAEFLWLDITLEKDGVVFVSAPVRYSASAAGTMVLTLKLDGSTKDAIARTMLAGESDGRELTARIDVPAGSHTLKIQGVASAGTATIAAGSAHINAIALG
jgi:hypothetical protein